MEHLSRKRCVVCVHYFKSHLCRQRLRIHRCWGSDFHRKRGTRRRTPSAKGKGKGQGKVEATFYRCNDEITAKERQEENELRGQTNKCSRLWYDLSFIVSATAVNCGIEFGRLPTEYASWIAHLLDQRQSFLISRFCFYANKP